LARYVAAIALASFSTSDDTGEQKLSELQGNLSFGHFLTTVQEIVGLRSQHPAASLLAQGFKKKKLNKEIVPGPTDDAVVKLLNLRNVIGHDLRNLDEARAMAIEEEKDTPRAMFVHALEGVEALLSQPLFVLESQEWKIDTIVGRLLLLMGESANPTPETIQLQSGSGVTKTHAPYVAIGQLSLPLPPSLLWDIDQRQQNFVLLFIDAIEEKCARYCTIDGIKHHKEGETASQIRSIISGDRRIADTVVLVDGRHLAHEWTDKRALLEDAVRLNEGRVNWERMDQPTLSWFARQLDESMVNPHETICHRLLDGRSNVEAHELRQLTLLFGVPADVRADLHRDVLDLRVIDEDSLRPSKRELVESANLIEALKRAVRFLAGHFEMGALEPEDLKETEGSLDYLTLREVLVNQVVHQDYGDVSAAGQIEIHDRKVTVFNTGYSLVAPEKLLDGGKTQSRNPLIARALRSIGFAEIAGSGIRAVHRACQKAGRKAPKFESDSKANTFTLTLDWSEGEVEVDTYWRTVLGVELTMHQSLVMGAIAAAPSVTIGVIEEATGLDASDIADALDFLLFQLLVEQDESNYRLSDHIKEKLG